MRILIAISILLFAWKPFVGQTSNYETVLQGGRATLMSGAVVGGLFDNTAFYYNPGAVAYLDMATISINSSSIGWNYSNAKNAFGNNIGYSDIEGQFVPYMLAGTFPVKINNVPNLVLGYSFLINNTYDELIEVRYDNDYNVNPIIPGEERYYSRYSSQSSYSDKWLGLTASYKLNDKWGVGITNFFTFTSIRRSLDIKTSVIPNSNQLGAQSSSFNMGNRIDLFENGMVLKLGIAYHEQAHQFGLSVTLPQIGMDIFESSISQDINFEDVYFENENGDLTLVNSVLDANESTSARVKLKTPLKISFGYAWKPKPSRFVGLTVNYYHGVDEYTVFSAPKGDEWITSSNVIFRQSELFYNIEQNAVLNVALGVTEEVREGLQIIGGFRTNFSYLPDDQIGILTLGNVPQHNTSVDMYHLTGGVNGFLDKLGLNLTLGADLGFGLLQEAKQVINWSTPSVYSSENQIPLTGKIQETASYLNARLMFIVGAQFDF